MSDMYIDKLKIEVAANASNAEESLNKLTNSLSNLGKTCSTAVNNLTRISSALQKISAVNNYMYIASGIRQFSESLKGLNGIDVKTNGVSSFASSLSKLAKTDITGLSSNMQTLGKSIASLDGVNVKEGGINNLVNAFSRLSREDLSNASTHIQPIIQSIQSLQGLDVKTGGLSSFINAISRLTTADLTTLNAQAFETIQRFVTNLSTIRIDSSSLQGITPFLSSLNGLLARTDKMQEAAVNMPTLTSAMQEFMSSMANAPEVSESTVRMSESLAEIARNGGRVGSVMRELEGNTDSYSDASQRANSVMETMKTLFGTVVDSAKILGKTLVSMFQSIPSLAMSAVSGIKLFVEKLKEAKDQASGIDKLKNSISMLLYTVMGFRGVLGVFNWAKASIMAGANITEIDHIVKSVFGENMVGYVNEWADNAIEKFGIASGAAKQYAGVMSAMFQSSNVAVESSNKMALDLVELAGDLSAFYNIDTETAYNKIKSGMAGMVRPLRDLGIDLSAATMKEYALSLGIQKSYTDMTQAEKVMLRYKYLMAQTSTQQGDFQRTSLSMANSLRTLKAYASAVSTQIGVGLVAALRHAIIGLNILMKYVLKATTAFANFMQKIFGKYEGGASGVALDMGGMSDDAGDLATNVGDVNDALDDTDGEVKQIKKDLTVLPFDELNQLAKDVEEMSDGTGGNAGTGDIGGLLDPGDIEDTGSLLNSGLNAMERELSDFEKFLKKWKDKCAESLKAKDWEQLGKDLAWGFNKGISAIYNALNVDKIKAAIFPWIDAFTKTFNSFIDNLDFYKIGGSIGRIKDIIVSSFNRILDPKTGINWDNLGRKLAEGATGLLDNIPWEEMGKFWANKLNMLWYIAHGFVTDFPWSDFGQDLAREANAFVDQINFGMMAETVYTGMNGIIETLMQFLNDFNAWDFGKKLGQAIFDTITGIDWRRFGNALGTIWNKAWSFLRGVVTELGNEKGVGTGLGAAIHDAIRGAIDVASSKDFTATIKTFAQKIFEDMAAIFGDSSMWYDLGYSIGNAIGDIFGDPETMSKAAGAINAMVDGLISFFTGAFNALSNRKGEIDNGIKTFFKSLDWDDIWQVVGTIAAAKLALMIPKIVGLTLVTAAIRKWLIGTFTTLGTSSAVVTAETGLFAGMSTAIGSAAAGTGVLGGLVAISAKLSEINDKWRGGNGMISAVGKSYDDLIDKLLQTGNISSDVHEDLFQLKESYEEGTISASEFATQLNKALDESGVSAQKFVEDLLSMKAAGNVTQESIDSLLAVVGGSGESFGVFIDALRNSNLASKNSIARLQELKDKFDANEISAEDFATRFQQEMGGMNITAEDLAEILNGVSENSMNAREKLSLIALASGDVGTALSILTSNVVETGTAVDSLQPVFEQLGYSGDEAFSRMDRALGVFANNVGLQPAVLKDAFEEGYGTAEWTATNALQRVMTVMNEYGYSINDLRGVIDSELGEGTFDALQTATQNFTNFSTEAMTAVSGSIESIGTSAETTKGSVDGLTESVTLNKELTDQAKQSQSDYNTVTGETPTLFDTLVKGVFSLFAPTLLNSFGSETDYRTKGENTMTGFAEGASSKLSDVVSTIKATTDAVKNTFETQLNMHSPSKVTEGYGQNTDVGLANGIKGKQADVITAINNLVTAMKTNFSNGFLTLNESLKNNAATAADNIVNGFRNVMDTFDPASMVSDRFNAALDALGQYANSFYSAGQSIAESLAMGIYSVHIPNFEVEQIWSTVTYPNGGWIQYLSGLIPHWYARGGLFTRATIAGLGEAGNEAALPLENKHTMSMIANAITNNMDNGMLMDETALQSIITQGVVQAMMANQDNGQDPIFNIVVKTENDEVLARAVQRGSATYNYRNKY